MKIDFYHFIFLFFILFSFDGILAQELSLKLSSKSKDEILILNKIEYQKKHKDTIALYDEIDKISKYLKKLGYFTNTINSVEKKNSEFIANYSLNKKIKEAIISINPDHVFLFNNLKANKTTIPIKNLESSLDDLTKKLDNEGKSFSKVHLKNITIKGEILFADLDIYQSKKRYLNKVIIKRYEDFPKSFIKNHFNVTKKSVLNQQKIKEISNLSRNIRFIEEIKPPEVLFTKDSTLLYLYLKKKQNNSFDGIVNLITDNSGKATFNGNIDLKLNNILNQGEKFELFWNSITNERQEFRLSIKTPYIFNSKFTPQVSFSIYKQDSTLLTTNFNSELFYNLNTKSKIAMNFTSESSQNLEEIHTNEIASFTNYFIGFKFQYRIFKNDSFLNDKFLVEINPTFGRRNSNQNSSNQFKLQTTSSYIWDINLRNALYVKNTTGILISDNYLNNELFRIGGPKSIRGFNEQSIFIDKYTYFNVEYRYLTSNKSYLYSITDYGNLSNNNYIGIGMGYCFVKNKSIVNINSVLGNNNNQIFKLSNIQLNINWTTFF